MQRKPTLHLITEVISPTMQAERALTLSQELLDIPFPALLYTKLQIDRAFSDAAILPDAGRNDLHI